MKQYLLFGGLKYYPAGGWNDFIESFDDYQKATVFAISQEDKFSCNDWWHIIDKDSGELIAAGGAA